MSKKGAGYRLRKELLAINRDRPEFIWATHKETNILLWSFLVAPPDDTVYGGGWYWGRVTFPQDYPFAPPGIQFVTPSGRFRPVTGTCGHASATLLGADQQRPQHSRNSEPGREIGRWNR